MSQTILRIREDDAYKRLRKVLHDYPLSFTDMFYLTYHSSMPDSDDKLDSLLDDIADNDSRQLASKAMSALDDGYHS